MNILLEKVRMNELIPEKLAKKYCVFPIEIKDDNLLVEIVSEDLFAKQDLRLATGMNILFKIEDEDIIKNKIENYYSDSIKLDENYARKILYNIFEKSIEDNASDIHVEPYNDYLIVRARVDGVLKEVYKCSMELYSAIASIIKLDASLDITERRLPQDGRVDLKINELTVDFRVSTIPTIYGEKIVIRILNRDSFLKSKEELGFTDKSIQKINKIINKKSGIMLVTGPTGSGKTTTVYSILNELKSINKNILSIEDPVEYKMDGINQTQVNTKVGLTFEKGLRSLLRQDPDIIMIGEIRDVETAQIAIRAAITGHLVISTMHTNDAVSSITRLLDMNIEPYLINASLIGVISQKLVRKVCNKCCSDIVIKDRNKEAISTKVAVGCDKCNNGYSGRTAIYEVLDINDEIKECIRNISDSKSIKNAAKKNEMISFKDSCNELIERGITTLEECIMANEYI